MLEKDPLHHICTGLVCLPVTPLQVLLEYVDYGNEDEVELMKLRKALDTELFSLPFQVCVGECRGRGEERGVEGIGRLRGWMHRNRFAYM